MSLITHNNIQKWPSCLIIFSTNNMACCMLMGTFTYRRSLHAESTKYIIIRRPIPTFVRFLPDMDMFSHPKSPLPNSNFSRYHLSNLLRDSSNIDCLLRRPRQCSSSFMHVVRRFEKSLLGVSQSVDNGRGDEATGETTEIRRAGMDSLEIDEDVPESVDRAINRWAISKINDSDDDSCSETPETFKAKHMQEEMGRLHTRSPR